MLAFGGFAPSFSRLREKVPKADEGKRSGRLRVSLTRACGANTHSVLRIRSRIPVLTLSRRTAASISPQAGEANISARSSSLGSYSAGPANRIRLPSGSSTMKVRAPQASVRKV